MTGAPLYTINLDYVCRNQDFAPTQVVSSELVFPRGAVPNSQVLWIRIELVGGKRQFVTVSLSEFYKYVDLPESSIGGWTDGDRGSDNSGLNSRYEVDHSGSDEPLSDELQLRTESVEKALDSQISKEGEARPDT